MLPVITIAPRLSGVPAAALVSASQARVNAAKIAGASDRVGTLAKGRIANVIVVEGDLFADQPRIRRVFVDGRPVNIDLPATQAPAGGRRGGH